MDTKCIFCEMSSSKAVLASNSYAFFVKDQFPISQGHSLIILKRHISSFFDLTEQEIQGLMSLLNVAKGLLEEEYSIDSYNIGINDGPAAGQTIPHLHIHLIPRYDGDVEDPRGGLRWLFPEKAKYW